MTTIGHDRDVLTVIFEFTIEPGQQEELTTGIQGLIDDIVSKQPGFISSNLHVSRDKTKVLNYLQWESQDAFDSFRADEEKQNKIRPVIGPYNPQPRVFDIIYSKSS